MDAKKLFKQSHLALTLIPFTIRELFSLQSCPCDIYTFENGEFNEILREGSYLGPKVLKELISEGHTQVFTQESQRGKLIEIQQENLRQVTRSFSMGSPLDNCKRQLSLLTLNLRYLFEDPTNDGTLNLQYQSLKILFKFLYENPRKHEYIYHEFIKQGHHYIFTQPFISSLFLIGILKHSHAYSEKDVEQMFITSYFKDIGMSAIPVEKYDKEELTDKDKKILSKHAKLSVQILQGRLQISPLHFKIIEAHHSFSSLNSGVESSEKNNEVLISGFETMMVNITDIVAAVISPRPYRAPDSLFHALDIAKILMSTEYPDEFKLLVNYFRNFFSNTVK